MNATTVITKRNATLPKGIKAWPAAAIDKLVLWCFARLFGVLIAIFLCFPNRKRMSHDNGIGGEGWLKIVDDPQFPEHPFFEKGKQYPIRIRHASASFLDDAMNCVRSISIKFAHSRWKSPLDLELNSGPRGIFWNAVSFFKFGSMKNQKHGVQYVEYMKHYPDGVKAAELSLRRNPTSFNNLHFYSQTPFLFIGKDGLKRYAKYRVLPFHEEPETGRAYNLTSFDICNQRILPHETRGRNYLKYEYEDRVKNQKARYRLQIQLHTAREADSEEIFNNMILWNEQTHPWHELAHFNIDTILDWKESTLTSFSLNNMPATLGVIPAKSIYDYNSLNYLRTHAEIARVARLFSYKVFGMVPPIPDNGNRNTNEWE